MHRHMVEFAKIPRGPDETFMFSIDPDGPIEFWCHYVSDFGKVIGKERLPDEALDTARDRARRLETIFMARYAA